MAVSARLGNRLLEVLEVGGARKRRVLEALAMHWRYTKQTFEDTLAFMVRQKVLRRRWRNGGPHYVAAPPQPTRVVAWP